MRRLALVGHSLGGLSVRVFGGEQSASIHGAFLLDPTVPDPAITGLADELDRFGWDSAAAISQGMAVTAWPVDVPLTVLCHDAVVAVAGSWTEANQMRWNAGQVAYGRLTASGTQREVMDATHYVYRTHPQEVVTAINALLP